MGQRKLTGFEVDKITILLNDLDKAAELIGCNDARQYFPDAVDMLASMKTNRTTDGKPYVEPQPEIGDGYRQATTHEDRARIDREMCDVHGKWVPAPVGIYVGNYIYRVPVDRVPTDEEAKQRPMVMVRDAHNQPWKRAKLYGVALGTAYPFLCEKDSHTTVMLFCRFPYPGELD